MRRCSKTSSRHWKRASCRLRTRGRGLAQAILLAGRPVIPLGDQIFEIGERALPAGQRLVEDPPGAARLNIDIVLAVNRRARIVVGADVALGAVSGVERGVVDW